MAIDERDVRRMEEQELPDSKGTGLIKGLLVTLRHLLRPAVTQSYPDVKPDLRADAPRACGKDVKDTFETSAAAGFDDLYASIDNGSVGLEEAITATQELGGSTTDLITATPITMQATKNASLPN